MPRQRNLSSSSSTLRRVLIVRRPLLPSTRPWPEFYPDATVEVEREYKNALQGYALRVPAGSLDAIRGVSGVKLVSIERETRVQ